MNYQENKNNKPMILVYAILGVIFVVVIVIAIMMIRGYRWNIKTSNIEPFDVVQVRTTPVGTNISVDNKNLGFMNNGRFELAEGKHRVSVAKTGFRDWSDEVVSRGNRVRWLDIRLFPKNLETEILKTYSTLLKSYEAPNHRFILNHLAKNHFELVDLTDKEPKYIEIKLADYFTNSHQYNFEFVRWNMDRQSLVFQDKNSAKKQTIMIRYREKDPKATLDLTKQYAAQQLKFQNFVLRGASGTIMYSLENDKLYRLDLSATDKPAELLAENVTSYSALDENKVAYTQTDKSSLRHPVSVQIYNYKHLKAALFDKVMGNAKVRISMVRVHENDYLIYQVDKQLMVFKANREFFDLKPAVESKDLDYTKVSLLYEKFLELNQNKVSLVYNKYFDQEMELKSTDTNPRFVTLVSRGQVAKTAQKATTSGATSQQSLFVYDIANEESFTYNYNSLGGSNLNWLDNVITWQKSTSGLKTRYFNGSNQTTLEKVYPEYGVQFDGAENNLYYFVKNSDNKHDFSRLKLTVK